MMGIIYRDLKPENVLVRSDGHIMLTDFDLCLKCEGPASAAQLVDYRNLRVTSPSKSCAVYPAQACVLPDCFVPNLSCIRLNRRRNKRLHRHGAVGVVAEPIEARSMSFVGTHEYLAPEIVSGEGHGSAVDWWTLGVFIYELCYGVTPFRGSDNDFTLTNIVARGIEFPDEPRVSGPIKDLIGRLLVKDPMKRMGSMTGAAAIKCHPFFNGVNWALLRCTAPPYIPPEVDYQKFVPRRDAIDTSFEYY